MEKEKDNRKTIVLIVITTATFLTAMIGATFAYFTAQVGPTETSEIVVETSTTDSLVFNEGPTLEIKANQDNFRQGDPSITETSETSVELTASNGLEDGASAEYCYKATLNIDTNQIIYTTVDENGAVVANPPAELLFSASKNGNVVINELDITNETETTPMESVKIPTELNGTDYIHHITAEKDTTTTDNWVYTVTLVNLATDQNLNTGKTVEADVELSPVNCETGDPIDPTVSVTNP